MVSGKHKGKRRMDLEALSELEAEIGKSRAAKRAKAERLALKEVATRLEVQVATQQAAQQAAAAAGGGASAETDEEARFREIMKAQNEVVIELREENERLAAKIAVLEAK